MAVRAQDAPLKFWQFYAPGGQVATQVAWFEKTIADWNDSHDQKVELEYIPNTEYINGPKLATAFASGEGPDIFIISPGDFLRYYNGGVLQDLTPHIDAAAQADFPESVIANRMVDGKIYGIPMEVEPMAMYYSVKAFEDAGLNENDVPKTWDELLEIAKKLTTPSATACCSRRSPGYYQNFTWYPFMWQGGGEFQTKDGKSAFDSPATVQALKFWQDAVNLGVAPRQVLGDGGQRHGGQPRLRLLRHAERRHLGHLAADQQRQGLPVRRLQAADPAERQVRDRRRRLGVRRQRQGQEPGGGGRVLRLGAGLDGQGLDPARGRLVHQGAKSDMPPRNSALEAGAAAFSEGMIGIFSKEIHPGTRAEPRVPPEVYKIISDAIQADAARRRRSAGGGDRRVAAARRVPGLATAARRSSSRILPAGRPRLRGRGAAGCRLMLKKVPMAEQPARSKRIAKRRGLSAKQREWLAGYLFVLPDALGLLRLPRPADGAVAWCSAFSRSTASAPIASPGSPTTPDGEPTRCSGQARGSRRSTRSCWCPRSMSAGSGWRCWCSGPTASTA